MLQRTSMGSHCDWTNALMGGHSVWSAKCLMTDCYNFDSVCVHVCVHACVRVCVCVHVCVCVRVCVDGHKDWLFYLANYCFFDFNHGEELWKCVCIVAHYRDAWFYEISNSYVTWQCIIFVLFLPLCSLSCIFLVIISSLTLQISSNSLLIINYYKLMGTASTHIAVFINHSWKYFFLSL